MQLQFALCASSVKQLFANGRALLGPIAAAVFQQERLEGDLRSAHARLRAAASEAALSNASAAEHGVLQVSDLEALSGCWQKETMPALSKQSPCHGCNLRAHDCKSCCLDHGCGIPAGTPGCGRGESEAAGGLACAAGDADALFGLRRRNHLLLLRRPRHLPM